MGYIHEETNQSLVRIRAELEKEWDKKLQTSNLKKSGFKKMAGSY